MVYKFTEARIGLPVVTSITSVASAGLLNSTGIPVGTIVRGDDATLGGGEFIYLPGVSSNIVGSLVTYNTSGNTAALSVNTLTFGVNPVAVSMSANTSATALSWYQIAGSATIAKTAVKISPASAIWLSATAGKIFATATSGLQIMAAKTINSATIASATGTITVLINRPHIQGQKI